MNYKILRVAVLILIGAFSTISYAQKGKNYSCSYKVADLGNETSLTFTLPDNYQFGTLIPAELMVKNDPSSKVKMNTVVLKDRPYMVLSDVYKMQSKTSSMALMVFSPDGGSIDVAFINMGEKPSARFFSGKCSIN
jgi:hypothetical protein